MHPEMRVRHGSAEELMQLTLMANGRLHVRDAAGAVREIGPEHPDYQRLCAEYRSAVKPNYSRLRIGGAVFILIGLVGWWYNWHTVMTEGYFNIKLTILGPLGLFGGLLMMVRPEFAGPLRPDSPKAHKMSMFVLIGLMAVVAGIDFYLLSHYHR